MVLGDTHALDFLGPVGIGTLVIHQREAVRAGIVTQFGGRHHLQVLGDLVEGHIAVVVHVHAAFLALLGRDDDHAVGGLGAVDRGRGSIAQDVDRLDVVRRHEREVHARNAVHDVVRLHGGSRAEGGGAAQRDAGGTVRVARLGNHETGHLALQQGCGIGVNTHVQIIRLDRGDRGRDVPAGRAAVADHHHIVQEVVVLLERDIDDPGMGNEFLFGKADERDHERGAFAHRDDILAIQVGHDAVGRPFLEHTGSGEGLSELVADDTGDIHLSKCGRPPQQDKQRRNQGFSIQFKSHLLFLFG